MRQVLLDVEFSGVEFREPHVVQALDKNLDIWGNTLRHKYHYRANGTASGTQGVRAPPRPLFCRNNVSDKTSERNVKKKKIKPECEEKKEIKKKKKKKKK